MRITVKTKLDLAFATVIILSGVTVWRFALNLTAGGPDHRDAEFERL
jgi:hypothetical protein